MHRHALVHLVTEFPETARDSLVITNPGQQIVVRRQHTPDPPVGAAATTGRPLAIASTTVSPKALPTTCLEKDIRIVKAVILLVAAHIRQPFDPESPIRAVGDGLRDSPRQNGPPATKQPLPQTRPRGPPLLITGNESKHRHGVEEALLLSPIRQKQHAQRRVRVQRQHLQPGLTRRPDPAFEIRADPLCRCTPPGSPPSPLPVHPSPRAPPRSKPPGPPIRKR